MSVWQHSVRNCSCAFTLREAERLKSKKLIDKLFQEGISLSASPIRLVYCFIPSSLYPNPYPAQVAFSVSARVFKRAVDRNRIKRLMREAYRLHKHLLYAFLKKKGVHCAMIFIYTSKNMPDYPHVEKKIKFLLEHLGKNENNQ